MDKKFCFCTLALRPKYRALAKTLAKDLQKHSPGTILVIGTDNVDDFSELENVNAFKLLPQGILHVYHDKRFVLERALSQFHTAIHIDADTRIIADLPNDVSPQVGVTANHIRNMVQHLQRYAPERLPLFNKLGEKFNVDVSEAPFFGESLYAVSVSNSEQAKCWISNWDKMARYLELHGAHAGEGNAMGLAAYIAGLEVSSAPWMEDIRQSTRHIDASHQSSKISEWQKLRRRIKFHYRLNRARILALSDFRFFYL